MAFMMLVMPGQLSDISLFRQEQYKGSYRLRSNNHSMSKFLPICLLALLTLPSCLPPSPYEDGFNILVSSRNTNSVKMYDGKTGEFLGDWVDPKENGLVAPQQLSLAPGGYVLISGRGNNALMKYDRRTSKFLGDFTSGYTLDNPTKFSFSPKGKIYVSQWGAQHSSVVRFDAQTGAFIDHYTDNLNQPLDHAWDQEGNFYVSCFGDKDVKRLLPGNGRLGSFTPPGTLEGPTDIWFDENGDLLVADWPVGMIKRFDGEDGLLLDTLLTGMVRLEGHGYGPDSLLYLCDWQSNLVLRYDPETGSLRDTIITEGGLQQPNSLLFLPKYDEDR